MLHEMVQKFETVQRYELWRYSTRTYKRTYKKKNVSIILPEHDVSVVAGLAIHASPAETLGVQREVLGHREDRIGQALLQSSVVLPLHLLRVRPVEAFVEVDLPAPVVHRQG